MDRELKEFQVKVFIFLAVIVVLIVFFGLPYIIIR
jgi:hypothetical protein